MTTLQSSSSGNPHVFGGPVVISLGPQPTMRDYAFTTAKGLLGAGSAFAALMQNLDTIKGVAGFVVFALTSLLVLGNLWIDRKTKKTRQLTEIEHARQMKAQADRAEAEARIAARHDDRDAHKREDETEIE